MNITIKIKKSVSTSNVILRDIFLTAFIIVLQFFQMHDDRFTNYIFGLLNYMKCQYVFLYSLLHFYIVLQISPSIYAYSKIS